MLKLPRRVQHRRPSRALSRRRVAARMFADEPPPSSTKDKEQKSFSILDFLGTLVKTTPAPPSPATPEIRAETKTGIKQDMDMFSLPPTPEEVPESGEQPGFSSALSDALSKSLDDTDKQDPYFPFEEDDDVDMDEDDTDYVINNLQAKRKLPYHDKAAPGLGEKMMDMDFEEWKKRVPDKKPTIEDFGDNIRSAKEEVDHRRKEMRKALKVQRQNFKRDLKTLDALKEIHAEIAIEMSKDASKEHTVIHRKQFTVMQLQRLGYLGTVSTVGGFLTQLYSEYLQLDAYLLKIPYIYRSARNMEFMVLYPEFRKRLAVLGLPTDGDYVECRNRFYMHVFNELPHPKRALPRVVLDSKKIRTNLSNNLTKQFYQKLLESAHGPNSFVPGDYRDPDFRKRLKMFKQDFHGDPALYKSMYDASMSETHLMENFYAPPDTKEMNDLLTFSPTGDYEEFEKDFLGRNEDVIKEETDELLMNQPEAEVGDEEADITPELRELRRERMEEMAENMAKERHSFISFRKVLSQKRKHERLYNNFIPPMDELIPHKDNPPGNPYEDNVVVADPIDQKAMDDGTYVPKPSNPDEMRPDQRIEHELATLLAHATHDRNYPYDGQARLEHLEADVLMSLNVAEEALRSPEPLVLGAQLVMEQEEQERRTTPEQEYYAMRDQAMDKVGALQYEPTIPLPNLLFEKLDQKRDQDNPIPGLGSAEEVQETMKRLKTEWSSKGEKDPYEEEQFKRSYAATQELIQAAQRDYLKKKQKQQDVLEETPDPFSPQNIDPQVAEWMNIVKNTPRGQPPSKEEVKLRKELVQRFKKEKRKPRVSKKKNPQS